MNPDQESPSVNDPYDVTTYLQTRRKSQYAKEPAVFSPSSNQQSEDGQRAVKTIGTTSTYIITAAIPSSTAMTPPTYLQQERRHLSKELFTIHQQQQAYQRDEFYSKNLFIASTLMVTYLIEVTVQILLIVQCCRSLKVDLVTETQTTSLWSWILVISSLLSSLLVTLIGIIWVFRGMDFSGRLCGRFLCYVMHSFLLGLVWRYLKLAFAYDKADLDEFLKLKTIQTYVQSLPLVTIHIAWLLTTNQLPSYFHQHPTDSYHGLSSWLVVAEMLCAVTSLLVLSSYVSSTSTPSICNNLQRIVVIPRTPISTTISPSRETNHQSIRESRVTVGSDCAKGDPNRQFNDSGTASTDNQHDNDTIIEPRMQIMTTIKIMMSHYSKSSGPGRALLLVSRLISLGTLVYEMNYWTGFIILLHVGVSFIWLSLWMLRPNITRQRNMNTCSSGARTETQIVSGEAHKVSCKYDNELDSTISSLPVTVDTAHQQINENPTSFNPVFGLASCMKSVVHRAHYANPGNDSKKDNGTRNAWYGRQVLTRVLPLTYVLFWDLSSSPTAYTLSNRLKLWVTALPVLVTAVENVSITMFHYWYNQQNAILIPVTSGLCFVFGWVFVTIFHCQKQVKLLRERKPEKIVVSDKNDVEDKNYCDDDGDSGYGRNNREDSTREKIVNDKDTSECLSLCCSSLSHALNIKRKGHQEHNFRNKMSFVQNHDNVQCPTSSPVKYNEYHDQHQLTSCSINNSRLNSNEGWSGGKGTIENSTIFPDLDFLNDHTSVDQEKTEHMKNLQKYQHGVMACAKLNPTTKSSSPVTNNYTNVKEALARRISNKSCGSTKKQSRINQDGESVKRDGEGGQLREVISSFKSSSSPSTRLPPPTTNSNKCMPISIKSSISWLPETCCNDSSGSSNSRNTNTFPESKFYCPENYIDLDNNNESVQRSTKDDCDFSIVFFEGRASSGTTRSHKQKRSRAQLANGLRAARSANTTPLVSSKHFPLDIRAVHQLEKNQLHHHHHHHHHPYSYSHEQYESRMQHQHQYTYDDDPIERASKGTRRNQITGKTYLSDGGSLTSLDGLCEIRASTPVEIKKASRVIVNYPPPHHQISDSKTVSRCLCKVENPSPKVSRKCVAVAESVNVHGDETLGVAMVASRNNDIYEKLIDDSYGILICEGENTPRQSGSGNVVTASRNKSNDNCIAYQGCLSEPEMSSSCRLGSRIGGVAPTGVHIPSQKLRILCAKCFENHDPLLTNCVNVDEDRNPYPTGVEYHQRESGMKKRHYFHPTDAKNSLPQIISDSPFPSHTPESDTTDYPSDTEFTTNNIVEDDGQSLSTHFSSATYSWHHNHYQPTQLSQFIWAASSMMPTGGGQCPKEFTSLEYVRTWLMASHPRTYPINNINNTHAHPHHHNHSLQPTNNGNDNGSKTCSSIIQRSKTMTSKNLHSQQHHQHNRHYTPRNDKNAESSCNISIKNKSCDKTISKKKRFRQLEKRRRPIGRGASPPAKELCTNNNIDIISAPVTTTTNVCGDGDDFQASLVPTNATSTSTRLQSPPSRKQHPLLFYDMIPRQQQQKPLTATTHKKCRDQLDLFHKELETVV